ncbi:MAG: glycoside hydrolase family 28 protein [Pedobacter sp.]|nr:MAG: glycoside hydrolase family 28 protein [Pedobacter sp.]
MDKKILVSLIQKSFVPVGFLLIVFHSAIYSQPAPGLSWVKNVGARKAPSVKRVYMVNDYGAITNGNIIATKAIQAAIDDCARKGGGIVSFKPGIYLMGAVFLKTNVHLKIDSGVLIKGSQNFDDYPEIDTRIAGIEMKWPAALINIIGQKKAAVTGGGKVNAQGKVYWDYYWKLRAEYEAKNLRWIVDYDAKRPRSFLVQESSDILLKGITFQQAGFWTVQVLYSNHVTIDGVTIQNNIGGHGPSTDGIDIDSSSWVLIQNSDIDCNDDNFCLKAGRDWDGLRVNRPTEYVVIKDCIARKGAGLLTLGSETSGSIRHVYASNIKGIATNNCLNIKSAFTRGGTVEDIYLENVTMDSVGTVLQINMNWNPAYSYSELPKGYDPKKIPDHWKKLLMKVDPVSKGTPTFKDIYMSNINIKGARRAINVIGMKESYVQNINLTNVNIEAVTAGSIIHSRNWKLKNFSLKTKDGTSVKVEQSEGVKFP